MNNSQTVNLSSFSPRITGISPFTLSIFPSGISTQSKVYKITYDFGDGTIVDDILSYDNDPLNNIKTNVYYLTANLNKSFDVKTYVYQLGTSLSYNYNFSLDLIVPSLEAIDSISQTLCSNYFEEVHLVGSRMFGPNNDILYIFESTNPNYIIPVAVNWKAKPIENIVAALKDHYRPYRLLEPFEKDSVTSYETGTNIVMVGADTAAVNPDEGSPDME